MIDTQLLAKICEIPGTPGHEKRIRDFIKSEVTPYVDEVSIDNLGNLFAFKKGKTNKKVMLASHLDEIGFMVTHIDDNGFIFFPPLGGFDPKTLTAQRVWIHGKKDILGVMGTKPIHVMSPEERTKMPKISDFFIDVGMSKAEVSEIVKIGDTVTRERELVEIGNAVNCKSLDNRVSVYIQLEMLRELKDVILPYDVYAVFTVQEEVGLRGAKVAAHSINPDFGIALDVTIAYDVPGSSPKEEVTKLGKGAAIKILDGSTICDYRMVNYMKATAEQHNIPHQMEILQAGGTDTEGVQRWGKNGSIAGAISIPTRNLHQVIEMADKTDIRNCIELLKACLSGLNSYNWEH